MKNKKVNQNWRKKWFESVSKSSPEILPFPYFFYEYFINPNNGEYLYKVSFFDILTAEELSNLRKGLRKENHKGIISLKEELPQLDLKMNFLDGKFSRKICNFSIPEEKLLKDISITIAQINDYYYFVEYAITLNKKINGESLRKQCLFLIENLNSLDYQILWSKDYNIHNLLGIALQHFVTTYCFNKKGKRIPLKCIFYVFDSDGYKKRDACGISNCKYYSLFSKKNSNIQIAFNLMMPDNYYLISDRIIDDPDFDPCGLALTYKNAFAYSFLGDVEVNNFDLKYHNFFFGRKRRFHPTRFLKTSSSNVILLMDPIRMYFHLLKIYCMSGIINQILQVVWQDIAMQR